MWRWTRRRPRTWVPGSVWTERFHLLALKDVLYVGGPSDELSALSERSRTMFRPDADGRHAVKVQVEFGLTGRSPREPSFDKVIEIRSGLRPGDTLILSDMTAFTEKDRVRIQ
jgi:HlyD family secretion protein